VRGRHKRWSNLRIAQHYTLPVSTVVTILRREGLARLAAVDPTPSHRAVRTRPAR
jgi:hypothetical protein